jgi:hypothetical protein
MNEQLEALYEARRAFCRDWARYRKQLAKRFAADDAIAASDDAMRDRILDMAADQHIRYAVRAFDTSIPDEELEDPDWDYDGEESLRYVEESKARLA